MAIDGFATPGWLGLLVVLAVLAGVYVWVQKRRRHMLRFANLALLERVASRNPGWSRHLALALLLLGLILLTVALAGPTARVQVPRNRATVMLVLDVSLSMRPNDVAPSRLGAAQDAAAQFVQAMPPTINLGLESFASTPALLVAPTIDREPVLGQIQSLKLAESTATGEAIATALNAIDSVNQLIPGSEAGPPPARIVLMSDGKQTVGRDEFDFATQAEQRHIPISTISFGTLDGTIDLQGREIPVPVDDPALAQVARLCSMPRSRVQRGCGQASGTVLDSPVKSRDYQ